MVTNKHYINIYCKSNAGNVMVPTVIMFEKLG